MNRQPSWEEPPATSKAASKTHKYGLRHNKLPALNRQTSTRAGTRSKSVSTDKIQHRMKPKKHKYQELVVQAKKAASTQLVSQVQVQIKSQTVHRETGASTTGWRKGHSLPNRMVPI